MRVLDLFSGIGGFSLGLERAGMETVAFCEIEPYCQAVLRKHWPEVPIHDDVRSIDGREYSPDIICGGYPCQPFSLAGDRKGDQDDRHLWPEMFRIIKGCRPNWVLGENVAGHITMGIDEVLSDLESEDYTTQTFVIPACAVDAPHRRDRVWIVAHAESERCRKARQHRTGPEKRAASASTSWPSITNTKLQQRSECLSDRRGGGISEQTTEKRRQENGQTSGCCAPSSDASGNRRQGRRDGRSIAPGTDEESTRREAGRAFQSDVTPNTICRERSQRGSTGRMGRQEQVSRNGAWEITSEPLVCRGAHGISNRMDRLRALGNAVVPQVVEEIGRAIMDAESHAATAS